MCVCVCIQHARNVPTNYCRLFRLTNVYFVDIPDARGRLDILTKLTKSGTRPKLAKDVDLAAISREERCESFSGADLASLVSCTGTVPSIKKKNRTTTVPSYNASRLTELLPSAWKR